jgi:hypothetical protein
MITLHIGGASTASVIVSVFLIFFLLFAVSFAFGRIPEGGRRFSSAWIGAWFRASLPRLLVAGASAGALGLAAVLLGNNPGGSASAGSACRQPLAPLTGQAVSQTRLVAAVGGMEQIAEAAAAGAASRAQTLFFSLDAHNVTHDIDRPLRAADDGLARDLCLNVVVLETQMATTLDTEVIEREARTIAQQLTTARGVMDFSATASPGQALDPCVGPLGAVTNEPLTAQRLQAAIDTTRRLSAEAATGDQNGLKVLFFGDAHNITHDIDGPLRQADEQLGIDLCNSVLQLEREFSLSFNRRVIADKANETADLLGQAGQTLRILPQ